MRSTPSIRLRLLAILLGLFALGWILITTASYFAARHEVEELFDTALAGYARSLQAVARHAVEHNEPGLLELRTDFPGHEYEHKLVFQVWSGALDTRPTLLMRSESAPEGLVMGGPGYADVLLEGHLWRVFHLADTTGHPHVLVAERYDVRDELVQAISLQILHPLILGVPLLALALWFGVGGGLRPLHRVAAAVKRRSPYNLQPVAVEREVPAEVRPLLGAINDLLARLAEAFQRERRFTADAAHELRTPLASLKVQAQVALGASDEGERSEALRRIDGGVTRSAHLVSQLLTISRLDPDAASDAWVDVDLARAAIEVVAELAPGALAKGLDIAVTERSSGRVRGLPEPLRVLIRNLVDNAIKYTPSGGQIEVSVAEEGERTTLRVSDDGPGISAPHRTRVFDRFYRIPGHQTTGSGLGLSIARRIVELHQAELSFAPESASGLQVVVSFPAAA